MATLVDTMPHTGSGFTFRAGTFGIDYKDAAPDNTAAKTSKPEIRNEWIGTSQFCTEESLELQHEVSILCILSFIPSPS